MTSSDQAAIDDAFLAGLVELRTKGLRAKPTGPVPHYAPFLLSQQTAVCAGMVEIDLAQAMHRLFAERRILIDMIGAPNRERIFLTTADSSASSQMRLAMHKTLLAFAFGATLAVTCRALGLDIAAARAFDPHRQKAPNMIWRAQSRARHIAAYLLNGAAGVDQRSLARLLGVTPAAICLGLKAIEDLRDDPSFDDLVSAIEIEVTGRAT